MSKSPRNTPETHPAGDSEPRADQAVLSQKTVSDPAHNPHLLRFLRETANLTQAALAKAIKVEPEMVIDWETGRRHPSQKHQQALEKFFRIPSGGLPWK